MWRPVNKAYRVQVNDTDPVGCRSWFPSTMRVMGVRLMLTGVITSSFTRLNHLTSPNKDRHP